MPFLAAAAAAVVQARAFAGWQHTVSWRKHSRLLVSRALVRLQQRMLAAAFEAWLRDVEERKIEAKVATKEGMQVWWRFVLQKSQLAVRPGCPSGSLRQCGSGLLSIPG
jgi:Flp pilus assembly protein TadB